jgi:hypothetical protein
MKRANNCAECDELFCRLKRLNGKLVALGGAGLETVDQDKLVYWVLLHQAALASLRAHRHSHMDRDWGANSQAS